ncbi:MAG: DUF484 family protein [Alphaproteobacteria bacterium]|nr:DUF484 family protein [Alphaproteobacteria bacterium]
MARRLSKDQVATYLKAHPTFLNDHPDLLLHLTPPSQQRGNGILDMQRFMIERLQEEVAQLRLRQHEFLDASRVNLSSQERIHNAVLALLEARTFEHLLEILGSDLARLLDVDMVSLCFETTEAFRSRKKVRGLILLQPGVIDGLVGEGRDVLLRDETGGDRLLFGASATKVSSDALVRLTVSRAGPPGLLALGSRTASRFHPGQGTELLKFLAGAVSRCARAWLDLPPA